MYQYTVSFGEAISRAFSKYCCFSGRASRSEYWYFMLFSIIIGWLVGFGTGVFKASLNPADTPSLGSSILCTVVGLIFFLPSLGLVWRRLHDIGKGGGWYFIGFIPVVGAIVLLIWFCTPSQPEPNRFGPVPNLREYGK